MPILGDRIKNAWNAFRGRDPTPQYTYSYGTGQRPDRTRMSRTNIRSILSAVYNQIAVDCSSININHVRLDENGRYKETIQSSLNRALTVEANVDQTGRNLLRDVVLSMFDEGCIAIVPTVTSKNPEMTDSYDVYELRVGKIINWYPKRVRVEVYNEDIGKKETVVLDKSFVAIVENPFYGIMNEPNSIAKRLIRVLSQLDKTNDDIGSNRLDLIIQLPYQIKSDARRKQAETRRKDIEAQLTNSQLGIAYTDGTERVVQLNRSLENNLWAQAKDLQEQLYNQLGFSKAIFDGTADEQAMLNYNNRTIEPIMTAITEEMGRKWISKTAETQGQAIRYFKDPFKLVPVAQLAEITDKFTRNEIMTSNEFRAVIGMKPAEDPRADELRNANLNHPDEEGTRTDDGELTHHGVKGMHWGIRNGPPYPLQSLTGSKTPTELSEKMRGISYGNFTSLKTPEQVLESKRGSCYDQVLLEQRELRSMGLDPKIDFFIWQDPKTELGGPCHAYVYYEDKGKINWFENSWGTQRGIHTYDSKEEMREDVKRLSNRENSANSELKDYTRILFSDFGSHKYGEDYKEVADAALKTIGKKMNYG